MLTVSSSNSLRALLDLVAEAIAGLDPLEALFSPRDVAVPHPAWAAVLRVEAARRLGAVGNLAVHQGLPSLLERVVGPGHRVVSPRVLQGLVLRVLDDLDALSAETRCEPLVSYLVGEAWTPRDALVRRRFDLGVRLATLFGRYGAWRRDLLEPWLDGQAAPTTTHQRSFAEWERVVYQLTIRELERLRERTGEHWVLPWAVDAALTAADLELAPQILVVGFPWLSRLDRDLLAWLAEATDVRVFELQPAPEVREDLGELPGPALPSAAELKDRPLADAADAAALPGADLHRWSLLAREQRRAWHLLAREARGPVTLRPHWDEPPSPRTLLGAVQADVLRRSPSPPAEVGFDPSLRVLACPNRRRELEVVAEAIWERVSSAADEAEDERLRFDQIAVVLPPSRDEALRYEALLPGVFQEAHDLPHTPLRGAGAWFREAVERLLALPTSHFTRDDLLPLLEDALGADPHVGDTEPCLRWAEQLAIHWGAGAEDHVGTYLEGLGRFDWEQGLRRLAAGVYMSGERSQDERPAELGPVRALPLELPDGQAVGRFVALVRGLVADAREALARPRSCAAWAKLLAEWVERALPVPDTEPGRLLRERSLRALRSLGEVDPASQREVVFPEARALALQALETVTDDVPGLAAGGLAVLRLDARRPLPFRLIFAVGLGEDAAPRRVERDLLDLVRPGSRLGDPTREREDRHAFLSLLLAPSDALVLSYVARDPVTGTEREPSALVRELQDLLARGYVPPDQARTVERPPARAKPFAFGAARAQQEARARALRADFAQAHPEAAAPPPWATLKEGLPREAVAPVERLLAIPRPPEPAAPELRGPFRLHLSVLARFLQSPLHAWASVVLRLGADDDGDLTATSQEPLVAGPMFETVLLREVFLAELGGASREIAYAARRDHHELRGRLPIGLFGAVMDRRAHAILDAWHARFRELDLVGPAAVVAFGAPESNGDDALPALDLDARHPSGQPVVLVGDTWPVVLDGPAALSLSTAATPQARHLEERRYVRGFVDLLALRAAGALSRRPHAHVHVILGGARQPEPRSWRLGSVEEATAHLSLLARELFAGPHDYLLPVEAWRRWQDADDELSLADHVRALRDAAWVRTSDDYGPLPGPARLGPPDDAEDRAERRWRPYVEWTA